MKPGLFGLILLALVQLACSRDPCSNDCNWFGQCTAQGSTCVAASNADCERGGACRDYGKCTAKGGSCIIGSDADCRRAAPCRLDGRCFAGPKDKCAAGKDADCAASEACRDRGLCVARRGLCAKP